MPINFRKAGAPAAAQLDLLEQPTLPPQKLRQADTVPDQFKAAKQVTGIEWTQMTWNPMVGCSIHTAGCTNCYAMAQAAKITAKHYDGVVKWVGKGDNTKTVWTGKLNMAPPHILNKPRGLRTPTMIFVNSMSDFFHQDMPFEFQLAAMRVMEDTPQHVYQILTKRAEEIEKFVGEMRRLSGDDWSFPDHVWVGCTMEREDYRFRIDHLRVIPAAVKFLSIEPLVGPAGDLDLKGIDWVIIGGESGPGSRPMKEEWVLPVVRDCVNQNVPVFFKQWGIKQNNPIWIEGGDAALRAQDPVGKGGSLVRGHHYKAFPHKYTQGA